MPWLAHRHLLGGATGQRCQGSADQVPDVQMFPRIGYRNQPLAKASLPFADLIRGSLSLPRPVRQLPLLA